MTLTEQQARKIAMKIGKTMNRELLKIGKPIADDVFLVGTMFSSGIIISCSNLDENEATNLTNIYCEILKKIVKGSMQKMIENLTPESESFDAEEKEEPPL